MSTHRDFHSAFGGHAELYPSLKRAQDVARKLRIGDPDWHYIPRDAYGGGFVVEILDENRDQVGYF